MSPAPPSDGKESPVSAAKAAVAGAIAGCISRLVVGPLDVIKIRFQVQREPVRALTASASKYTGVGQALRTIVREEGVLGLWRGTLPAQLLTIPYCAVQFVVLQQVKTSLKNLGIDKSHPLHPASAFLSGAVAGAAATAASYPFDLIRTRLAAQGVPKVHKGMLDAARAVVASDGARGLYRGLGITLVEIIPYAAIQFGLYEALKTGWRDARERRAGGGFGAAVGASPPADTTLQQFTCGLAAGMAAKLATHPLDVVKKRVQIAGLQRSLAYGSRIDREVMMGMGKCLARIVREEGVRGLYKGLTPSLIKSAPASAVTFAAYEFVIGFLTAMG